MLLLMAMMTASCPNERETLVRDCSRWCHRPLCDLRVVSQRFSLWPERAQASNRASNSPPDSNTGDSRVRGNENRRISALFSDLTTESFGLQDTNFCLSCRPTLSCSTSSNDDKIDRQN